MNTIKLWLVANWPKVAAAFLNGAVAGASAYWVVGMPLTKASFIGLAGAAVSRGIGYVIAALAPKKEVLVAAQRAALQRTR